MISLSLSLHPNSTTTKANDFQAITSQQQQQQLATTTTTTTIKQQQQIKEWEQLAQHNLTLHWIAWQ